MVLQGNGTHCEDVDECRDPSAHLCSAAHTVCANTPGSYQCACAANYQLDSASRTCEPVNPCLGGVSPCHADATCRYAGPGRYNCSCKAGFAGDGKDCKREFPAINPSRL